MHRLQSIDLASLVQAGALLAGLAGILVWSQAPGRPVVPGAPLEAAPAAVAVAPGAARQWFSSRAQAAQIQVLGLLGGERGALAILAVDGAPAQAFRVGERLLEDVRLVAVEPDAVVIERGAERQRLAIARLPEGPALPDLR